MRIVHIIPGLDSAASEILKTEHLRALETASVSARQFSEKVTGATLKVFEVCDLSWLPLQVNEVELFREPIKTLSTGQGATIRPVVGSFLPKELINAADFVIFSNADICFRPNFHEWVHQEIDNGILAGSVNRATIPGINPGDTDSIPRALATNDWRAHPGSDCFFFPASNAFHLQKSNLVMGIPKVGRHILMTLSALNVSFKVYPTCGVTFHFGDDGVWKTSPELGNLRARNLRLFYWGAFKLSFLVGFQDRVRGLATARALTSGGLLGLLWRAIIGSLSIFRLRR